MVALGTLASISPSVTFVALVVSIELGMAAAMGTMGETMGTNGDHQPVRAGTEAWGSGWQSHLGRAPGRKGKMKQSPLSSVGLSKQGLDPGLGEAGVLGLWGL